MSNSNWQHGLDRTLPFTQDIITSNNITIKNGIREIDTFMIISTHPTSHKIKAKMPMEESGHLTSLKLEWDLEESTISTTSWLATTSNHPMESMCPRENISIRIFFENVDISIIWLLVCLDNSMMDLLNMKMVHQLQLLRWLMMWLISLYSCKEGMAIHILISRLENGWYL